MSRVFLARDTLIGRTVAVKILRQDAQGDQETRTRFVREAQLAGSVNHENIIRVYDFGEEAGQLFMVMEFLEGEDLNDVIRNGRAGSIERRLQIALQVARAMQHIHTLQIVHRDLKPHNVYLTTGGMAKLMDFGIAKTNESSITRTGFAVGTPVYMAPEQVRGETATERTDVYAFGMFLFELVTGAKPWVEENIERIFWQVLNGPLNWDLLRERGAPEWVIELIRRCTEKLPAQRPASFDEVIRILETQGAPLANNPTVTMAAAEIPTLVAPVRANVQQPTARTEVQQPTAAPLTKDSFAPSKPAWLLPAIAVGVIALAGIAFLLTRSGGNQSTTAATSAPVVAAKPDAAPAPPATLSLPSGDMVLVPAGPFLFGENNETQETGAYYIDKTEVTNAAYGVFLAETGYASPPGFQDVDPAKPVVNVTVADARAFARWAGKRLPNELEWEKAARGTDGRPYPWGGAAKASEARVGGAKGPRAAHTQGSPTPYGTEEMAGNAWEWVDQEETPSAEALKRSAPGLAPRPTATEPWRQARGGSFAFPLLKVFEKMVVPERFRTDDIGFRCVRDVR